MGSDIGDVCEWRVVSGWVGSERGDVGGWVVT